MTGKTFIQVALNGDSKHLEVPKTPEAVTQDARAAFLAGASSVHVHAFDELYKETFCARACDCLLSAIRSSCPGLPISLTTSATIEPDPSKRLNQIKQWTQMPDLVTINQGEQGILELSDWLITKGIKIEAGLLSIADAQQFVRSPFRHECHRVLIEPLDPDPEMALSNAAQMEAIVGDAGITTHQVHHGYGMACWAVNMRAFYRGHGLRTGLEDVDVLPNGLTAENNLQLVQTLVSMTH